MLADGAPKQILRAASRPFMQWVLEKLASLGADTETLVTHDAVHGRGAKWTKVCPGARIIWRHSCARAQLRL